VPLIDTQHRSMALEEDHHARRSKAGSSVSLHAVVPPSIFSHANSFPAATYKVLFKSLRARGYSVKPSEKYGHDARYPVSDNWPHMVQQLVDFASKVGRQAGEPVCWWAIPLGGFCQPDGRGAAAPTWPRCGAY